MLDVKEGGFRGPPCCVDIYVDVLTPKDKSKRAYSRSLTLILSELNLNPCWCGLGEFKKTYFIADLNTFNGKD